MKELKQAIAAAWAQVGIAALPALKAMTNNAIWAANVVGQFLSENRELVGTAVTVAGKLSAIAAAFLAVGTGITAVLNPIGLTVAAVAGLIYLFPQLRQSIMSSVGYLGKIFGQLGSIVHEVMQGIGDAMAGGSLQAAARVLWAGIRLAWLIGTKDIRDVYQKMVTQISSIGIDLFAGLQSAWVSTCQLMGDAWAVLMDSFVSVWVLHQNMIAQGMAVLIAAWEGINVQDVLNELTQMQKGDAGQRAKALEQNLLTREREAQQQLADIERQRQDNQGANDDQMKAKEAEARKQLADAKKELQDARDEAADLAKLKKRPIFAPDIPAGGTQPQGNEQMAATLSTFSSTGVGRQNIGGFASMSSSLKSINEQAKIIADNTGKNPFAWNA